VTKGRRVRVVMQRLETEPRTVRFSMDKLPQEPRVIHFAVKRVTEVRRTPGRAKPKASSGHPRPSRIERTAYHEAGHAVASIILRVGVRYVTIIPDLKEGSLGHCAGVSSLRSPDQYEEHHFRRIFERGIIVRLAGTIAEAELTGRHGKGFNHVPRTRGPSGWDGDVAIDLAYPITGGPEELSAYLDWLYFRTRNLLRVHHHWRAVERLAAALLERKKLSGREARRVIFAAFNEGLPPLSESLVASLRAMKKGHRAATNSGRNA
jgi:hypothetical protein